MDGEHLVTVRSWFTLSRHDILDKPTTTVGIDPDGAVKLVDALASKLRQTQQDLNNWDLYYRGKQQLAFLEPDVALHVGERIKSMIINWPRLILDSLEERLNVTGFRQAGQQSPDDEIWRVWQANDMDLNSGRVNLASLRHGRSFMTVWAGKNATTPRMAPETAKQMVVDYEPGSTVVRSALKSWQDGTTTYANLFLPDRIVKYARGGAVMGQPTATSSSSWKILPQGLIENPMGIVPVVPFLNRWDLDMPDGESELADVIPLTDAVCKLATDMMVASEFHAMPRRWATGIEIPKGPDKRRIEKEAKEYWDNATAGKTWLAGTGVAFGQFASADLQNFVRAIGMLTQNIGAIAGLPPHYMGLQGDNPASADAIRSAEASLVKRAERKKVSLGESYEDAVTLMTMVRDGAAPDGVESLETMWADSATPTVAEKADAAIKLQSGGIIDVQQSQEDLGYTPIQIERMRDRKLAALAEQATAEMRARVAAAVDLIQTYGVDEKVAFASVGLITAPKGQDAGPEAPPPVPGQES